MKKQKHLNSIILGKENDEFVTTEDNKHVFLCGPTSSGKSTSFVIPNLLNWQNSAIIFDSTGKNYDVTSGYRSKYLKNKVIRWSPVSKEGYTGLYNPFDWISKDSSEQVSNIIDITYKILPDEEFWSNESRTLLIGIILYLCSNPKETVSLGRVGRIMKSDDVVYNLAIIMDKWGRKMYPQGYSHIASFLQKDERERSGVISTLNSAISAWSDPVLDELTESSNFSIENIRKNKTSIYVCINPSDIARTKTVINIFFKQIISSLTSEDNQSQEPLLLMIDDLSVFADSMSLDKENSNGKPYLDLLISSLVNYNIVLCSVFQNYGQVETILNDSNNIFANSAHRICFSTNDSKTREVFTENAYIRNGKNVERLDDYILPTLDSDKELLLSESEVAKIIDKVPYYDDEFFKGKVLKPAAISRHNMKGPNFYDSIIEFKKEDDKESKKTQT
jgi:type IV secretion system protein VirD4